MSVKDLKSHLVIEHGTPRKEGRALTDSANPCFSLNTYSDNVNC